MDASVTEMHTSENNAWNGFNLTGPLRHEVFCVLFMIVYNVQKLEGKLENNVLCRAFKDSNVTLIKLIILTL